MTYDDRSKAGCDCHVHLLADTCSGSMNVSSAVERLRETLESISMTRCVLVQPTLYGTDCTVLLNACRLLGAHARGVAAETPWVSDLQLDVMHQAGIRGLRFTAVRDPTTDAIHKGGVGIEHLERLLPRLKERRWHVELWVPPAFIVAEHRALLALNVPLVIDHLGLITSLDEPAIPVLCDLLASGQVWTKLSLCRITADEAQKTATRKLHDRLVSKWPRQLMWGSDWPYLGLQVPRDMPRLMLETFHEWIGDAELARIILSENPAAFYDFESRGLNSTRSSSGSRT